jgi:oligopeptide/dipeptide ABC transporter ATP-binding protein
VEALTLSFRTPDGRVRALDEVGFAVRRGEVMGFVGESGSGKSVTALAILGLLPPHATVVEGGRILFRGQDLLTLRAGEIERIRGKAIGIVFQSPGASLNPLLRVGTQLEEVIRVHRRIDATAARREAEGLLERVGLTPTVRRAYPHELSGGMQQRACIAIAVSCHPDLLIADEPTSSLDVSIQAQILDLLRELRASRLIQSIIFITHDFGLVDLLCDRVTVLYAGQVVEAGPTPEILRRPQHPYTRGLLAAIPRLDRRGTDLGYIPGGVPNLLVPPPGCRFHPRCPDAMAACRATRPAVTSPDAERSVRCHLFQAEPAAVG